jgi:hypothetical protein
LSCLSVPRILAQEAPPKPVEHFYHLVFQIEEIDGAGKVTNSRAYSTMTATGTSRGWPIKTGNKIPLHTGEKDIQYLDTGINIDIENTVEDSAGIHLIVKVEVSSLAPEQNSTAADPVIRQNAWGTEIHLPVGKPTVIFSSDNLENKGRTQVELTASRVE